MKLKKTLNFGFVSSVGILMSQLVFGANVQGAALLTDIPLQTAQSLVSLSIYNPLEVTSIPSLRPLTIFEGNESSCEEAGDTGLVCFEGGRFYVDDSLMQKDKEFSLKPPKTGIGFIDNNRNLIGAATAGGMVAGPTGILVGAFWGDKESSRQKIEEMKQSNRQAEAALAQTKLDRAIEQERWKNEQKVLIESNVCLQGNTQAQLVAIKAFDTYLGNFNKCLESATDDVSSQSCLDTYYSSVLGLLTLSKTITGCN